MDKKEFIGKVEFPQAMKEIGVEVSVIEERARIRKIFVRYINSIQIERERRKKVSSKFVIPLGAFKKYMGRVLFLIDNPDYVRKTGGLAENG